MLGAARMGLHNMGAACSFQAVRPHTLGLIGLGAIGGSVARQAKRAGVATVLGWSPEPGERVAAVLLVLAAPPVANVAQLEALVPQLHAGALVTDVGSVKRAIVHQAERLGWGARFAGSHPLAGTHRRGFEASRADLFRGALVYVTPCTAGEDAAREIAHFWAQVLEAHPVVLDAAGHDAQLAATSHVPQIVASLLAHFLARHCPPGASLGPGARDTTRLAASDPALWTEILLLNRDELLPALRSLEEPLGAVERALEAGDAPALTAWL